MCNKINNGQKNVMISNKKYHLPSFTNDAYIHYNPFILHHSNFQNFLSRMGYDAVTLYFVKKGRLYRKATFKWKLPCKRKSHFN